MCDTFELLLFTSADAAHFHKCDLRRESLDKEAMAQLLSAAKARGLLTEDGSLDLPTNVAVIVTATAA